MLRTTTFPGGSPQPTSSAGPALIEPFGQALLEGMACGRSVVATRVGGPPEFVPDGAGVLVDPLDTGELARALETAAALPVAERRGARTPPPSTTSGVRRSGWRRSSCEPFEIGEPDRDQRRDALLQPVLAGDRERLLVALADLLRRHALLEPVVARQEQIVDLAPGLVGVHLRIMADDRAAAGRGGARVSYPRAAMLPFFAVIHVLLSVSLIGLVLMHSGRDAGLGGMGFTPASQGGTHIVERNLTRVTAVIAILFLANTILLFRLLK